jgi:hypothetical protein
MSSIKRDFLRVRINKYLHFRGLVRGFVFAYSLPTGIKIALLEPLFASLSLIGLLTILTFLTESILCPFSVSETVYETVFQNGYCKFQRARFKMPTPYSSLLERRFTPKTQQKMVYILPPPLQLLA